MVLFSSAPTLQSESADGLRGPIGSWNAVIASCFFVALPWLWPALYGPKNDMWPNLVAWGSGAVLLVLLPWTRERAAIAIASGWLCAAVISAAMGLLQFFDLEDSFSPWVLATRPGHVLGNVHQVNLLATLLGAGLLSLWWMVNNRYLKPLVACMMAVLLIVALAATASRTGMLHAIVISGLLLYWGRLDRRVAVVVTIGVLLYAIAALSLPWLQHALGIATGRDLVSRFTVTSPCSSRRVLWLNVLQLISMKPWTGWGWDGLTYAHYITSYDGFRFCEKLSNAHNLPLQLAVSIGVPMAGLLILTFLFFVWKLKPWSARESSEQLGWGVLLLLGLHSMLEYPLWFGVPQLMAICAVWLVLCSNRKNLIAMSGKFTAFLSFPRRAAFATLVLVGLTYTAWDYFKVTQLFTPSAERHQRYRSETLKKVGKSWLFQQYVLYAVVNTTPIDATNANLVLDAALEVLNDFPDPEIIIKVIDAARLTGDAGLVALHQERFRSAWPKEFATWDAEQSRAGE